MGILDSIANVIKGYDFSEPIVIKESSTAKKQVDEMIQLKEVLTEEGQAAIDFDIKLLQAGIYGEDSILFELKNSHLPVLVLRDLQLSFKGLEAQIDYIVLTPKAILVIECKNMIGDIEVNSNGDFIRKFTYGRRTNKEGIYSPITQNQRHLDLLRKIFNDKQDNFVLKTILEKEFNRLFLPYIVVANPKTVLNVKYAKKDVKEKIIRLDQLNKTIRDIIDNSEKVGYKYVEIEKYANSILDYHRVKPIDLKKKYERYLKPIQNEIKIEPVKDVVIVVETEVVSESTTTTLESSEMYQALKKYRLEQSRKENVKPYFLFNNLQLETLVKSAPKNREELMKVNGFGTVKCDKYGEEILRIIHTFK